MIYPFLFVLLFLLAIQTFRIKLLKEHRRKYYLNWQLSEIEISKYRVENSVLRHTISEMTFDASNKN